jgi:hypothetical protein
MTRQSAPEGARQTTATAVDRNRSGHRFSDGTPDLRTVEQVQAAAHRRFLEEEERLRADRVRRARLERFEGACW